MRLGILGTGMIVNYGALPTVEQLRDKFEYVSILGVKNLEDEVIKIVDKYQLDRYHLDYEEMLETDIDTVYVALPNHLHFEFAKKALLKGKNAIIEKPITVNTKQLEILEKIAAENQVIILEAMTLFYLPAYEALKTSLPLVGDIKLVNFTYSQYSSRYDAFKSGEILPAFDYKKAGGAIMDLNIYNINALVGLFGKPNHLYYSANIERKIDTSGVLTMNYDNFSAIAVAAKDSKSINISTIQGDKGYIKIEKPFNSISEFTFVSNEGNQRKFNFNQEANKFVYEFDAFIDIIKNKKMDKANKMMENSKFVQSIIEEARKQQGILFPFDKETK